LFLPELTPLQKVNAEFISNTFENHPSIRLQMQNQSIAEAEFQVQKQSNKPSFDGRFFSQRLYGLSNPYSGFSVSIGIPIFGRAAYRSNIKAAELEKEYQSSISNLEIGALRGNYNQAFQELKKEEELLLFYETSGLQQANAIIKAANLAYRGGEISFSELSQFLTQAIDIQKSYLEVLNRYNQSAIQLNYFLNR